MKSTPCRMAGGAFVNGALLFKIFSFEYYQHISAQNGYTKARKVVDPSQGTSIT